VHTHLALPANPPQVVSVGTLVVECKDLEAAKHLAQGLVDAINAQGPEIIRP